MSCYHPLTAYWRDAARSVITFDKVQSRTKVPFNLPCGRCIGCKMDKANEWGLRCLHEAKMWPHNCFVTLTYNDKFLPPGGSVCLRDVQLFMKRLRFEKKSSKSNPIRFFLGAEYGDENRRPHYHALLFNCGFGDARPFGKNPRGEMLYISDELSRLWSVDGETMGHCTIGAVTLESAVYCAKYAFKKIVVTDASPQEARDRWEQHYVVYDGDGCVYERDPEFAVMSRRPGIGSGYYEKYGAELLAHDNIRVDGRFVRPPRFYDTRSEASASERFAVIKAARKRAAVKDVVKADNTDERLRVKERIAQIAAEKKERKL